MLDRTHTQPARNQGVSVTQEDDGSGRRNGSGAGAAPVGALVRWTVVCGLAAMPFGILDSWTTAGQVFIATASLATAIRTASERKQSNG